jgi:hypothetical protein
VTLAQIFPSDIKLLEDSSISITFSVHACSLAANLFGHVTVSLGLQKDSAADRKFRETVVIGTGFSKGKRHIPADLRPGVRKRHQLGGKRDHIFGEIERRHCKKKKN